jgi:hypothetical protein
MRHLQLPHARCRLSHLDFLSLVRGGGSKSLTSLLDRKNINPLLVTMDIKPLRLLALGRLTHMEFGAKITNQHGRRRRSKRLNLSADSSANLPRCRERSGTCGTAVRSFRPHRRDFYGRVSHRYFHIAYLPLICVGSLIAIMLGRLRMTIEEAIAAYKDLSPKIFEKKWWTQFQPTKYFGAEMQRYWFEGKNLECEVKKLLTEKKLDPKLKLWESDDPSCRVYILSTQLLLLDIADRIYQ